MAFRCAGYRPPDWLADIDRAINDELPSWLSDDAARGDVWDGERVAGLGAWDGDELFGVLTWSPYGKGRCG